MDANQRSEVNNQTNNGANEKWTPGAKGNTTSGPMDHTYPQGPSRQDTIRGENEMHANQDPSRMGRQEAAAEDGGRADNQTTLAGAVQADLPGGSLQSQQTGGSGPQQGITDSHQRQMEQRSGAWGLLEQPVGHRDKHSGTDLNAHPGDPHGSNPTTHATNPQDPRQPELRSGSPDRHSDTPPDLYQHQGGTLQDQQGNRQSGEGTGMAIGPHPSKPQRRES